MTDEDLTAISFLLDAEDEVREVKRGDEGGSVERGEYGRGGEDRGE